VHGPCTKIFIGYKIECFIHNSDTTSSVELRLLCKAGCTYEVDLCPIAHTYTLYLVKVFGVSPTAWGLLHGGERGRGEKGTGDDDAGY
jgi:hypothetical protein